MIEIASGVARRGRIRLYRSSALTTSSSGTFVVLPWDAESSTPTKTGFTHSTSVSAENITCEIAGRYQVNGVVKLSSGTWNELRVSLEVNGTAKATPNAGASSGLLGLATNPGSQVISCVLSLAIGDVVRVRIASVGQSSVALDVGETDTWLELSPLL
jgi:hypothetical protein